MQYQNISLWLYLCLYLEVGSPGNSTTEDGMLCCLCCLLLLSHLSQQMHLAIKVWKVNWCPSYFLYFLYKLKFGIGAALSSSTGFPHTCFINVGKKQGLKRKFTSTYVMWSSKMSRNSQILFLRYSQTNPIVSFVSYCLFNLSTVCIFGTNCSISVGYSPN